MQLLSMHVDTVRALQRLHIPFDDLTPDGLWGTPYHLIGVTGDQRDVLNAWGVAYDEVTPAVFQRTGLGVAPIQGGSNGSRGGGATVGGGGSSRLDARTESRVEFRPEPRVEARPEPVAPAAPVAAPVSAQAATPAAPPPSAPSASTAPAATAPAAAPAAAAAAKPAASTAATTATATAPAADDQLRDGTRLRTSFRGRYREATVRGGKILLDGRSFDSLTQASTSISTDKNDWEFWEYFDDGAGKWRMLDREWQA